MKQATMTAPGRIEVRDDAAVPTPGPGQVLMRVQRIGVCGSDIHVYHGKHPYTGYPVIQGHEFSGSIESVGEGVTGIAPGDKVTALPQVVCGRCPPCRRGDDHICDVLRVQGFQAPGCAQELWVTDASKIVKLPSSFSFEQGALVEPISVAVHATARAGNLSGRNTLVLGAGPIGNLVGQVARAGGAKVLLTDLSDYRLDIARRCGLDLVCNPKKEPVKDAVRRAFGDDGFDLAFECVGVEATLTDATANLAKGGTLVVVGVFGDKPRMDLGLVQDRELNIAGTLMYQRRDYERAVELIASGAVITEPLMSKHFKLDDFLDAYHYIEREGEKSMKVFIDVT
jgi:2-desacetyl-2-hydroxyethyl bacteriochlorophyllide A dehydrogenase